MIAAPRFWFVLLSFGLLQAAEPPAVPLLRIEAGMHTARINRIATDAGGRVALTCSNDRTARLWQLPKPGAKRGSAKLLRVLRVPIGAGDEGELYACALSPDGSIAAVGGYTGYEWDAKACLYLFDADNGSLTRRLSGLPSSVNDLAFSASGQLLAAGLSMDGIRVWHVDSGEEFGRDTNYGDACYGLDWRGDDFLASSCFDGNLRLYKLGKPRALVLAREHKTSAGNHPVAVRFSPDGRDLAVGYHGKATVSIHSADDLSLRYQPSVVGIDNGDLVTVAWSHDGRSLVSGGAWQKLYDDIWQCPVRVWGQAGRGPHQDLATPRSTVLDLRPLPTGGFLFASGGPAWGIVPMPKFRADGSDKQSITPLVDHALILGSSPSGDYGDNSFEERFQMTADASRISYEYELGFKPANFDVNNRALVAEADLASTKLHRPQIKGLDIKDWNFSGKPTLNGKSLALPPLETSRSLCIAPDGSRFVLGCSWSLRCFNAQGQEMWLQRVGDNCRSVNMSKDGRIAVAAYGDGTIRWHDVADQGRELMAFFPHVDGKRWVLWANRYEPVRQGRLGAGVKGTGDQGKAPLVIESVVPGSPAESGGLQPGDKLLTLDDLRPTTTEEATAYIKARDPGTTLRVRYQRNGEEKEVSVVLVVNPDAPLNITGNYYDASPGGEELLGWHINQGKDQAPQWVELGRFRDIAYRPDVIDRLLDTWDVGEALRLADAARPQPVLAADTPEPGQIVPARPVVSQQEMIAQRLPPVVSWVGITGRELAFDWPRVTLRYQVQRPPGQKLRGMALWVNGERTAVLPPAPADNDTVAEVTLPVPSRHSHVMLQADGPYNSSELLDLNLRWTGAVGGAAPVLKPKLHALVIGVGDYQDPNITSLTCAVADARRLAETLKRQEGRRYQEVRVQLLTSDAKEEASKATFGNITKQLSWLRTSAAQPDVSMVYLVGHGLPDPEPQADGGTPDRLFALADYQEVDESTRISVPFVRDRLAKLAGKTFLFLDTCHSGLVENLNLTANRTLGWKSAQQTASTKAAEQVAEAGVVTFSACRGNQFAKEDLTLGHGYFTLAVTEGLDGKADLDGSTEVTVAELTRYVADRVNEFSGRAADGLEGTAGKPARGFCPEPPTPLT
ncbi:MAG: PDZ domain-containing protein [Verrucomicrobiaceae bacterium]